MTLTSFVFTELANTMKYGRGVLYNLIFTDWRHRVSQNIYTTLIYPCQNEIEAVPERGLPETGLVMAQAIGHILPSSIK